MGKHGDLLRSDLLGSILGALDAISGHLSPNPSQSLSFSAGSAAKRNFSELIGPLAVTYCVFLKGQHLIGCSQIWAN